jgi:hypothetical protein
MMVEIPNMTDLKVMNDRGSSKANGSVNEVFEMTFEEASSSV